jgi:multicomponent Na+:H+ antiporter subunit B
VTAAQRRWLLLPALAVIGGGLLWALTGLPDFGHYAGPYGNVINTIAVPQRHVDNTVAATVFDYRGLDTMGEEFILFCALLGVVLLLRAQGERDAPAEDRTRSDATRIFGLLLFGPALLIGGWLAAFGYITPGGGFQAGVVLAGAVMLLYLAWGHGPFARATREELLDVGESVGAGGYVVIGLIALLSGAPFLHNLLGHGTTGSLYASGSIALLNWATAIEVTAANVLLFREFLTSYIAPLIGEEG